jgi:hypothetical protein
MRGEGEVMSAIKERPLLFSAPMVRAILESRKTVTRRPISAKLMSRFDEPRGQADIDAGYPFIECHDGFHPAAMFCPYGQPGDRLWVRESLGYDCEYGHYFAAGGAHGETVYLCSLFDNDDAQAGPSYDGLLPERSVPSIHLHRRYSRILLEITSVRAERLQDGEGETTDESRYVAEGIHRIHHGDGDYYFHPFKNEPGPGNWADPFDAWRELWVSINGGDSWNANSWVWVVEFKQVTP